MQETQRCSLIPLLRRSPGIGNGNPVQYSFLENSMGRGVYHAIVQGATKSQTQLNMNIYAHSKQKLMQYSCQTSKKVLICDRYRYR